MVGGWVSGRFVEVAVSSGRMLSPPPSWKYDDTFEIRFRQSMHSNLKRNRAKFHPDLMWNDGALDFFEEHRSNKNMNKNMSSDMGSVPSPKII